MARVDVHMRETDAFSWSMESDPRLRMPVVAVALLDGTPDWAEVTARMERVTRAVPMFRQRVVLPPGRLAPPKWVVDDGFDLAWHVRHVQVPAPATVDAVLDLAAQLGSTAFDPARPLWEVWLVDGVAGGGAAFIAKIHHTLTDGLGGVQLLTHLFDRGGRPLADGPVPDAPPAGRTAALALLRGAIAHDARQVLGVARGGVAAAGRTLASARRDPVDALAGAAATWRSVLETIAPSGEKLSPVMRARGLSHRYAFVDVPLAGLRAAGAAVGGTVNDAYLTAVTGGMRRYHELHGAPVPELRVVLPVNVREPDDAIAGNRMALIRYLLPLQPADPLARMREVKRRTEHWKNAPGLAYMEAAYGAVNWLPTRYLQSLALHVDLVASNVPGIEVPVRFAGPRLTAFYPFAPTGGSAVNVTLMSYAGTCHVGVNADADALPDLDAFVSCLRAGFDEVLAAATVRPAVAAAR